MAEDIAITAGIHAQFASVAGTEVISKAVQKAAESFRIDPKALSKIEKAMADSTRQFSNMVAKARAVGLHDDMDKIQGKLLGLQEQLSKDAIKAAELQAQFEKETDKLAKGRIKMEMDALNQTVEKRRSLLAEELETVGEVMKRRTEVLDTFAGKAGKVQMADAGVDMANNFIDGLGRVDPTNLKPLADGFGKALGRSGAVMEAVGGRLAARGGGVGRGAGAGRAIAGAGTKLAAAAGSLAAVAGVFAGIIALIAKADAQTKEWNKTIMANAGAADFAITNAREGIDDLEGSLKAARKAALDVAWQFRQQPKDILEIVGAANEAGFTFKEIERTLSKSGDKMEAYSNLTRTAVVYSKTLGVSTQEIAQTTADWMHDFGGGLRTIEEGFGSIFAAAMESGIGAKRFFGMVTQATAGLALYNVRVEEAAGLIAELAEGLGETNASNFVQGLQKGFAGESYTERFKRIIIAGQKDVSNIMGNAAENTAMAFGRRMEESGITDSIGKAFDKAGVKGFSVTAMAEGDPEAVKALAGMSEEQIRHVTTQLRATDDTAARQMETMIRLSKGVEGGLGDQAKALDELDMGGKLAMMLQTLGDTPLSELSARGLAAFEQYAGISGEQLKELRRVDGQLRGNYEELQRLQKEAEKGRKFSKEEMESQAKAFGGFINESGQIVAGAIDDANQQKELKNVGDLIQSQEKTLASAVEEPMSAQEKLTQEIVRNTETVANLLNTKIAGILEGIGGFASGILGFIRKDSPEAQANRQKLLDEIASNRSILQQNLKTAEQDLAELRKKGAPAGKIAEVEKAIAVMEKGVEQAREQERGVVTGKGRKDIEKMRREAGMAGPALGEDFNYKEDMEEALNVVSGPIEGVREELSSQNKANMDFLQRKNPGIMQESFYRALQQEGASNLAAITASATGGSQSEILQRMLTGKGLTKHEVEVLEGTRGVDEEMLTLFGGRHRTKKTADVGDFIYRGGARGGVITPINRADELLGGKPGGPVADALAAGGGGMVQININGGDTAKVYGIVKKALRESGVRPPPGGRKG